MMIDMQNPHAGQLVLRSGPSVTDARRSVILVHGRGDSASGILQLAQELNMPDVAFIAPQAAGNTWYPYSFLTPMEKNEPHLSGALATLRALVDTLAQQGVDPTRLVIMGFSQGACLSLEFAARNARRYGGVVALSGGLIGPPGTPRNYSGSFDDTPVFLGCSDVDAHIPVERVHESADIFGAMNATVDERIYPGMGHTVNEDELAAVRALLRK